MGSNLVCFTTPSNNQQVIVSAAVQATKELFCSGYGYKKAGVVFTKLQDAAHTMYSLFDDAQDREKQQRLSVAMDAIRNTYGKHALTIASQGTTKEYSLSENQSPHYTTLWSDLPKVSVK